jgi:hypothetical protein
MVAAISGGEGKAMNTTNSRTGTHQSSRRNAAGATALFAGAIGVLAGVASLAGPRHAAALDDPVACGDDGTSCAYARLSVVCGASPSEARSGGRAVVVHVDGNELTSFDDLILIHLADRLASHACRWVADDAAHPTAAWVPPRAHNRLAPAKAPNPR